MVTLLAGRGIGPAAASNAVVGPPAVSCLSINGPCQIADSDEVLIGPAGGPPGLVTNFGLLLPSAASNGWELLCEETFRAQVSDRVRRTGTGRLFVPASDGLYVSGDSCVFARAGGSLGAWSIVDVAIDPTDPARVFALSRIPNALHLSTDSGQGFSEKKRFPVELRPTRIHIAPSDPRMIYVSGYLPKQPLALSASSDGGETFSDLPMAALTEGAEGVELLGVQPGAPQNLLAAAGRTGIADDIWRSVDGGRTWTKVLTLRGSEVKEGFTFSADGTMAFVAGRPLAPREGDVPAHLYRSRDGGATWEQPIASGAKGPRYRCLGQQGGRLYACAGDPSDEFLLGVSSDDGQSWTPAITLRDILGTRPCAQAACQATAVWLCESYRTACGANGPPEPQQPLPAPDGGVDGPSCLSRDCTPEPPPGEGCGCALGRRHQVQGLAPAALLALVGWWGTRRRAGGDA